MNVNYNDIDNYIDKFIEEENIKREINDYVYKNIYPKSLDYLKYPTLKEVAIRNAERKFPKISVDVEIDYYINKENINLNTEKKELNNGIQKAADKLNKIENIITSLNNEKEKENKECPICLESIHEKSIVTGKCKHVFCANCIFINLHKNMSTGNLCPMCRKSIL